MSCHFYYNYNEKMPQAIVYLDEEENKIIEKYAKLWEMSKADTIKKMIRDKDKKEESK